MAPLHFNWLAIVVAAIINFALGGLWYAQPVFGRQWVAAIGKRPGVTALAASGGTTLIAAILLAVVISWTRASSVGDGLLVAGIGWLAFAGTGGVANVIFEPKRGLLFFINAGYQLVGFLIMGAIIAAWK